MVEAAIPEALLYWLPLQPIIRSIKSIFCMIYDIWVILLLWVTRRQELAMSFSFLILDPQWIVVSARCFPVAESLRTFASGHISFRSYRLWFTVFSWGTTFQMTGITCGCWAALAGFWVMPFRPSTVCLLKAHSFYYDRSLVRLGSVTCFVVPLVLTTRH